MRKSRKIYRFLIDIIFPNRCPVCNKVIRWDKLVCKKCESELPFINEPLCEKCGKDFCLDHSILAFEKIYCLMYFDGVCKDAIYRFKKGSLYNFGEYSAEKLCDILVQKGLSKDIDVCTAVPMSQIQTAIRGYNQAEILAHYIAKNLDLNENYMLLIHKEDNEVQHYLNANERRERANKVFCLPQKDKCDLSGKTVLLCDDVYTTGSTMNSCARLLKESGAKTVICVAIATTVLNDNME